MASYPNSLPTLTNPSPSNQMDDTGVELDVVIGAVNDEVEAIGTELGTNPKTITDATAASASPTSVAQYLDMVATQLKAIIGGANWYTSVTSSLATLVTHLANTSNPHSTSDANLSITDITTNDVSTSKHGFVPKAPNDTSKFFRGDGTWATTSGNVSTDSIWDAKGDLAAGTGANTASVLSVGANGKVLVANSAQSTGLEWVVLDYTYLANRTRSLWLPASAWSQSEASAALTAGSIDLDPHWLLDAAATESVVTSFLVPEDYASGNITAKIYFSMPSATSGNVQLHLRWLVTANNGDEAAAGESGSEDTVSVPGTAGYLKIHSHGNAITGAAAGSLIRVCVRRVGGSGSDTATGDMRFFGVKLEYTADM